MDWYTEGSTSSFNADAMDCQTTDAAVFDTEREVNSFWNSIIFDSFCTLRLAWEFCERARYHSKANLFNGFHLSEFVEFFTATRHVDKLGESFEIILSSDWFEF